MRKKVLSALKGIQLKIKSCLMILFLSLLFITEVHGEESVDKGRNNYLQIKKMYDKWDSGLFGSRKLYRNRLNRLLIDMIGHKIQTGRDYRISLPYVFDKNYYSSDLFNENWLHIHGAADESSIREFSEKGFDYIKEVERNKYLFFLSGRIEKFRIVETGYGKTVHLYLESVKITDTVK